VSLDPLNPAVPTGGDPYEALYRRLAALERRLEAAERGGAEGGDTGWLVFGVDIPLLSGTTQYPSSLHDNCAIRKLPSGIVVGRGLLNNIPAAGNPMFTVPAGMRPNTPGTDNDYIVHSASAGAYSELYRVKNATWQAVPTFTGIAWISFDGPLWFAEH
jgi:hypothetical protein